MVILEDGTKVVDVAFTGDSGGDSMKHLFMLLNHKKGELKPHIFLIYEAADTHYNSIPIYLEMRDQIDLVKDKVFTVTDEEGKEEKYKVRLVGIYDMSEQDTILGKQNSSSSLPCSKCKITLKHMKSESDAHERGHPHTSECCNFEVKELDEFYENFGRKNDEGDINQARKKGKDNMNVVHRPLLNFQSIKDFIDTLLHILMGLVNDLLKMLKEECRKFDEVEETPRDLEKEVRDKSQEMLEKEYARQYTMDGTKQFKNMVKRFPLVVENKMDKARQVASEYHNEEPSLRQSLTCQSKHCLLFPIDIRKGIDAEVECEKCGNSFHLLCEGISQLSLGNEDDIKYTCNKCNGYSDKEIIGKFHDTLKVLEKAEIRLIQEKTKLDMERQYCYHQIEEGQGPRLDRLQESMKKLNTKPGSYHGGDLNGVDCSKILEHVLRPDCRTYKENILLNCLADNSDRGVAFHEMFIILANVWQILRHPPKAGECGKFDDEELKLATYWCQQWAKQLPKHFPDRNLTRKGHALSCHIPETLSDYRSFYMFYKAEQLGEKVHSKFNELMRRWASVRPKTNRLLGMAKDFEAKNRYQL